MCGNPNHLVSLGPTAVSCEHSMSYVFSPAIYVIVGHGCTYCGKREVSLERGGNFPAIHPPCLKPDTTTMAASALLAVSSPTHSPRIARTATQRTPVLSFPLATAGGWIVRYTLIFGTPGRMIVDLRPWPIRPGLHDSVRHRTSRSFSD